MADEFPENVHFLSADTPIPGQSYYCLSLICPEDIVKSREMFYLKSFINELLNNPERRKFLMENEGRTLSYDETEDLYKGYLLNHEDALLAEFKAQNNYQTCVRGIKVRGAYDSLPEARYRAQQLQKKDPAHDVWVAGMGHWVPFNPNPDKMKDVEYANQDLNTLMREKMKMDERRDEVFTEDVKRKLEQAKAENEEKKKAIEIISENAPSTEESLEKIAEMNSLVDAKNKAYNDIMEERRQQQEQANAETSTETSTEASDSSDPTVASDSSAPPSSTDTHGVDKETTDALFGSDDPWLARKKSEKVDVNEVANNIF